ncbi:MAG: hypothetical protein K2Z81_00310 [Cyanobacteria bacterium]|nr:hypothetical protein [Cyanobacteriota bacterium]
MANRFFGGKLGLPMSSAKKLVQSVRIVSPCSVGWDNMEGDDKVSMRCRWVLAMGNQAK